MTDAPVLIPDQVAIKQFTEAMFAAMDGEAVFTSLGSKGMKAERFKADDSSLMNKLVGRNHNKEGVFLCCGNVDDKWTGPNPPKVEEIESNSFLWADIDFKDIAGVTTAEQGLQIVQQRLQRSVINSKTPLPAPSFAVMSGFGVHLYWFLVASITPEQAEQRNLWIARELEADRSTFNRNRVLRIGGSINWPSAKKATGGRVPALTKVLGGECKRYSPDLFQCAPIPAQAPVPKGAAPGSAPKQAAPIVAAAPIVNLDDDPHMKLQKDWVKRVIIHGRDPEGMKVWASRSDAVFAIVNELVRENVPDEKIASVLTDKDHGISESILEKKNVTRELERLLTKAHIAAADSDLAEMNERHAGVSVGGKYRVLTWVPHEQYPSQHIAEFSSRDDFCNINVHPRVNAGSVEKPRWVGRGDYFLEQDKHARYDGIEFSPGDPPVIERTDRTGHTFCYANMYSGFAVEAIAGNCQLYLDHVLQNVCDGDQDSNDYLLNWMASGVQRPGNPDRTAISMRGDPGTGKGVFVQEYGKIFGRHFQHITDAAQVTGRFNAHTAEVLLQFADEAMFAGNERDVQILKTLITEEIKMLERKGIDARAIRNYARLIFSSNGKHPLLIEAKDRRYFPLYVSGNHAKDKAYFLAILAEMRNGGRSALLHMLLHRNIEGFNAERMPKSAELDAQKLLSAGAGDRVIIGFAQDACLPGAMAGWDDGSRKIERPWIARSRGIGPNGERFLYDEMKHRGGRELQNADDTALADILKEWGFTSKHLRTQMGWIAPSLAQLRADLKAKFPALEFDETVSEWGAVSAEVAAAQRKAASAADDREAQHDIKV
jgi:hypothetical protein